MTWRKFWRRLFANDLIRDLRFIKVEYRYLYRRDIETGQVGRALRALMDAQKAGHFR